MVPLSIAQTSRLQAAPPNVPGALSTSLLAEVSFEDDAAYAREFGVSDADAARNLAIQELVGAVAESVAQRFPDEWVGHLVAHGKTVRVRSLVRGEDAKAELLRALQQTAGLTALEFTVETRSYSLSDIESVVSSIVSVSPIARPFDVDVDIDGGTVTILALPSGIAAAVLALEQTADRAGLAVKIEVVSEVSKPAISIYGGLHLVPDCTSGFTVRNNTTGTRGIAWAGHCPNASYSGVTLSTQSVALGGSSDLKWATASGHSYPNVIYDSLPPTYTRSITSTKSRSATGVGDFVCHYGRTSGYGCGQVKSKTFTPNWVPNATATYVEVQDDTSPYISLGEGGDSGGPWFYNSAAWGIHSGGAGPNSHGKNNGIYTSVSYIGNLGNVSIATS
jgi:hypothetical protein